MSGIALGIVISIIFFLSMSLSVARYSLSLFLIFSVASVLAFVGLYFYSQHIQEKISDSTSPESRALLDSIFASHAKVLGLGEQEFDSVKSSISVTAKYVLSVLGTFRAFGFVFAAMTVAVSSAILIATLMQVERLDQQNQLVEASRRAALINELTAILTEIDEELDNSDKADERMGDVENPVPGKSGTYISEGVELSKRLVWRIVALSRSLQPYRFLEESSLSKNPYSPERAQLLMSLVASGISLNDIFRMGSFEYSYLVDAELANVFLKDTKLSFSNFEGANLVTSDLSDAYLTDCNFKSAILFNVPMVNTDLRRSNFSDARMPEAFQLEGAKLDNIELNGAFVSSPSWLDDLEALDNPPTGLDRDRWLVSDELKDWYIDGEKAGAGYLVYGK